MQLASSARIPDGFMAAMRLGGEKPHQGLPGRNPALYQGPTVSNSTTALGLRGQAELNRVGSCSTGKERDTESGNDYFEARYYSSAMGRFLSPDPVKITTTRMLDPQGLNLYSYTRNRPLIAIDRDGNMTIVVVISNRTSDLNLYSDQGTKISEYHGLARGTAGTDRMVTNADTPFGRYLYSSSQGGTDKSRLGASYGTGKINMTPDAGEALDSGRTGVAIHGGGSNPKLVPDPYAGDQTLISTHGCVRLHNDDVNSLIGDIHTLETVNGEQNVGDSIYTGDMGTLSFMAGAFGSDFPDLVMPVAMLQMQQDSSLFNSGQPTVTLAPQPQQQPQEQKPQWRMSRA